MEYLETIDFTHKKDHGPNSTEKSTPKKPKLNQAEHDIAMLQVRLKYVRSLLQIEIDSPGPTPDVRLALETELEEVESQLKELEVLDAVMTDVEVVTPAFLSKPIFMKIFDSYNLVLQDLHRNFPTATNTHAKGYIKIEAKNEKDHEEISNYLKNKNLEFYTIKPPITRPLKLVIKGLPVDIDPEDIKNDLISKGIKIVKTTQLKRFVSKKLPFPYT
ncbi:uncharacterized protein TNCV_1670711 [Trichonephila clavipes]|nr:uncharacterized protein TNCV_1670711 [Trichonephila clavipes]